MLCITLSGFLATGCNKQKDTVAKIYVIDKNTNTPVQGCSVTLKGVSTGGGNSNALYNTLSNASGEAIFNLNDRYKRGQAGVAILNIEAKKNGLSGEGIIKIEEEKTNEATVFI